jgi:hypothetical protein
LDADHPENGVLIPRRNTPLAHASRKIRGGVALETDREDTLWAGRAARLQQIAGALR